MSIPVIRPPVIRDDQDLYQRDARAAIKRLDSPGVRKVTLAPVTLGTTAVLVKHQLGRLPVGWLVIDKTAAGDVFRDTTQPMSNDFLPLKASATTTVTIQVW